LIKRGSASLEVLHFPPSGAFDREVTGRIERCIQMIRDKDVLPGVRATAIRVAAQHKSAGLIEALLGYVPYADSDGEADEIRAALLKHGVKDGKADALLAAALSDRAPLRRAMAAEVLTRAAYAGHKDVLQKLLADPDAIVRYRLARSLALAKHREALPTLIDTIPDLPLSQAWQAEDFLLRLAPGLSAPTAAMGNDKDAREKCKAGWQEWWKKHGAKADLAKLEDTPKLLGRTLVILLDQDRVIELGPDNHPRVDVKGLNFPLDAQILDDERILVSEYKANRVTERNSRGDMIWSKVVNTGVHNGTNGPQAVQRLPNGNTFIATANHLFEYDKDDNLVVNISLGADGIQRIMKSMRLPNGEIVCMLAEGRIVRYDARGVEVHSFAIPVASRLFGGRIHMLPTGRIIVPHNGEGKVVEYDSRGKVVWEVPFEQPIAAMRLPNGNTLITSMSRDIGAVEVDRLGAHVWTYRDPDNSRVTRAFRR
jgi:hypothetical protein